jgi:HAD superfamily hydrolase (TIGR01490 family)
MNDLALFDLDETLLSGDSDIAWGEFLMERGVLDRATFQPRRQGFFDAYKAGTMDLAGFYRQQLEVLTLHPRAALEAWVEEYVATRIRPLITPRTRDLVRRHLDSGAVLALVTGTNAFTTGPIGRELGIPHLVATVPEWDGERFTGEVRGRPSAREGKVERVEDWLESLGLWWSSFGETWFYSDSHNDLPLLVKVSRPVAVDPDPILLQEASERGWPVISLR